MPINLMFSNKKEKRRPLPTTEVKEFEYNGLKWIDIIRPTKTQINMLRERFGFHELLLEDCMTEHQRAKIDQYEDYCFIVMHFPRYRKEQEVLESEEIDIFISSDYLITIHDGELKPLIELSTLCYKVSEAKEEYMNRGSAILLYEIIKRLFDYCFPLLDKIGGQLNEINRDVFKNSSRAMLENISKIKMQIINYRRVVKPLRIVILRLEKVISQFLPKGMDMYFDDITDKAEEIYDMLENHKEVIESVDTTFAALTNQRINNLMRTFTIIQVIILPMVLVSGLFSMNVKGIPMSNYQGAFWIVFGMIFIPTSLIGGLMLIKRKKWF